ncbi:MAG: calcium/sodium antiporter [Bacteroidales bacterium]|nr:calcium/sodium antiporter [Bacteroidales bacterium]MDY6002505.1 calcium/sodium antiporter [Candidatus Cryptobacteroides sp.]
MTYLLLILGLVLVVVGAEFLVDGSSSIARKAGLSEFVIGLTIVGIGTSTPEMVVSFSGAIKGISDVAIGNILGSNIFNVFLILGVTALIMPIPMTKSNVNVDSRLNIVVTSLLIISGLSYSICKFFGIEDNMAFLVGHENMLTRASGIIFLLLFAAYMVKSFKIGKKQAEKTTEMPEKEKNLFVYIIFVILGLVCLIYGGNLFVDEAVEIAKANGISEKFIAVTILAGGTSLPELVTCIVAAAKKKGQLALGNILGSNIANILLILGGSALIHPLSFSGMTAVDLISIMASSIIIWLSAFTGKRNCLDRFDGVLFLACEAAYMTYLIIKL